MPKQNNILIVSDMNGHIGSDVETFDAVRGGLSFETLKASELYCLVQHILQEGRLYAT